MVDLFQEKEYKKMGEELLETAWNTLNTGDWKLEKKLENGDMVQVSNTGFLLVDRILFSILIG